MKDNYLPEEFSPTTADLQRECKLRVDQLLATENRNRFKQFETECEELETEITRALEKAERENYDIYTAMQNDNSVDVVVETKKVKETLLAEMKQAIFRFM